MRHLAFLSIALVALMGSGDALAAAAAGKAVGVNPSAIDQIGAASRTLTVGADVAMGDKIVTGPTGQVQLIFNDDTHLVVGPSSSRVEWKGRRCRAAMPATASATALLPAAIP